MEKKTRWTKKPPAGEERPGDREEGLLTDHEHDPAVVPVTVVLVEVVKVVGHALVRTPERRRCEFAPRPAAPRTAA